jgi:hypothetical protein
MSDSGRLSAVRKSLHFVPDGAEAAVAHVFQQGRCAAIEFGVLAAAEVLLGIVCDLARIFTDVFVSPHLCALKSNARNLVRVWPWCGVFQHGFYGSTRLEGVFKWIK